MNTPDPLAQIVFVLDRPRDIINVGAVVRLMGNFGLSRLRLVEPAAWDPDRILTIARRGAAVLAAAERHPSLESALADCAYVLGTTRRERALHRPVLTPRQAAATLLAVTAGSGSVDGQLAAVLFGPEDKGLTNAALDRCHAILTIPAVPHDASLNLAQAALLVAYELRLAAFPELAQQAAPPSAVERHVSRETPLATGAELEAMFDAAHRMLLALHRPNIEGRTAVTMSRLRALLLRAAPSAEEASLLAGIFEHAAHALDQTLERERSR
jgi:TrmH family RNA methyltransferase